MVGDKSLSVLSANPVSKTDVLIVGGGLSGLALADRFEREGVDYVLLEARDRLGGRILSVDIDGVGFDLGPTWFWPSQPRMGAIVERFGLKAFEQHCTGGIVTEDQNGGVRHSAGFAAMQGSYRIEGGVGRIIDEFAAVLPPSRIRLNARVRSIEQEAAGILVTYSNDGVPHSISAEHVILAVPPRVAVETISFTPGLPGQAGQILQSIPTWMAGQAKILAVYDKPYWREKGLSGDAMSRRGPMIEIHDASAPEGPAALFGFVGFPSEVRRQHHDQMMKMAKHQLARLFGDELLEPRALILQDWSQDPLTCTARDLTPNIDHPVYKPLPVKNGLWDSRVRFCVTETATEFGGYLEGALESSERLGLRG